MSDKDQEKKPAEGEKKTTTTETKVTKKVVPATPPAYPKDLPATPPAYPKDHPTPPAYPQESAVLPGPGSKNVSPALAPKTPPAGAVPPAYVQVLPPPMKMLSHAAPFYPAGMLPPTADTPAYQSPDKLNPMAASPMVAGGSSDATQFAAPEQNLPVVLVYGLPLAGSSTLAKHFAEESKAVLLTSQVVDKAEPWAWSSAVLVKFQQTLSLAPKPIKQIVIDFPMKSLFELSYLVQWLKEHSIPLNAAIHVEDGGSALTRALATVNTSEEPEYETYLKSKYQKGAGVIGELKDFFTSQDISESVKYPQDGNLKSVMLDFKFALAKARSRRHSKVCSTPTLPYNFKGLRPLLNADFYRSAMEVLLTSVWSGRKGAVSIPHAEEIVGKDQWEQLFRAEGKTAATTAAETKGEASNNVPLPTVRAQVGTQGLLFWHPKHAGEKRPNKLYFVPKQQQMLFTVDQALWPFGNISKPCVLTCSVLPGATTTEVECEAKDVEGSAEKEKKPKAEKGTNSVLLMEDCLMWDGTSTFGKNYAARFGLLEKARGAQFTSSEDKEKEPISFGFGFEPVAFPTGASACELVLGLHKAVSIRTLSNWKNAPKPVPAGKGGRDKADPWTHFQVPNVERSIEYNWAKNYGVVMFDASSSLSLWSTQNVSHPTSWVPPVKVSSVFKLGAKKAAKTAEGHDQFDLLTLVPTSTDPKKKELVAVPQAESSTVTIKAAEYAAAGFVEGCDVVELRWVQPKKKKAAAAEGEANEGPHDNESFSTAPSGGGHWRLIKYRPDRVNCDTWAGVEKVGTLLPSEKQIESFNHWLKFAVECVPPTSQALQDLMMGGGAGAGGKKSPTPEPKKKENGGKSDKRKSHSGRNRK